MGLAAISAEALRAAEHAKSPLTAEVRKHALPPSHLRVPLTKYAVQRVLRQTRAGECMRAQARPKPRKQRHCGPLRAHPSGHGDGQQLVAAVHDGGFQPAGNLGGMLVPAMLPIFLGGGPRCDAVTLDMSVQDVCDNSKFQFHLLT